MAYAPKSFEEWWKGSGQMRGDAIFRNCWNAALETAAQACEQRIKRDAEYGGRFGGYGDFLGDKTGPECAADVRALQSKPRGL